MPNWEIDLSFLPENWDNSVVFITLASFVLWTIWTFVYRRLMIFAEKTTARWDNMILTALKGPVTAFIWCWPATISLDLLLQNSAGIDLSWVKPLQKLILISIFIWFFLRLINHTENYTLQTTSKDETTVQAIAKILRLTILATGILSFMQTFGLSLSGLLTFGGVGGLIVGFAAKDLLSNFFGGMMIYFDRPFKMGDWIRSPDREIEGTVERIGWRMTVIRTFDKRPLYIPNSVFSSIVVENPSRMLNRRIYETIGIRYQDIDHMDSIIQRVKTMLTEHPDIDNNQTMIVNFNQFGPSSLDFFIYTFTKTINWVRYHEIKQDVLLQIIQIIHDHEADIAFPTRTLHIEQTITSPSELTL